MKKITFCILLLILFFFEGSWLLAKENKNKISSEEILCKSDLVRGSAEGFRMKVRIEDYDKNKSKPGSKAKIYTYIKKLEEQSPIKSLVKFIEPAVNRGQVMLRVGNMIWLYSPNSRFIIRIPPQQRLLGNASNGDLSATNYRFSYSITDCKTTSNNYVLFLKSKDKQATYASIKYWINKNNFHPVKAEFYSESNRKIKTMLYEEYKLALEKMRPYKVRIIDSLNTSRYTVCYFEEYKKINLKDHYYQKNYLKYVP